MIIAAFEAGSVPSHVWKANPAELTRIVAATLVISGRALLWPFLMVALFALGSVLPLSGRAKIAVAAGAGFGGAGLAYLRMSSDATLAGYPPLIGLYAAIGAYLAFNHAAIERGGSFSRVVRFAAFAAAAGAYFAAKAILPGLYPGLHLSALFLCFLLLVSALEPSRRASGRRSAIGLSALAATLLVAVVLERSGTFDRSLPQVVDKTLVGLHLAVVGSFGDDSQFGRAPGLDPDAVRRFEKASGWPALPASFRLQDYNILLVLSEAMRFDETSLAPSRHSRQRTTPHLERFAQRGALSFTRAFAPSSGTLYSVGSLLSAGYPSALVLRAGKKSFHGDLKPENVTVSEVLREYGYDTWWVGHGHGFKQAAVGLEQGFARRRLLPGGDDHPECDREVVEGAIEELERAVQSSARFFGLVFFGSPHAGYLAHYPDWPAQTPRERYRQELRYTDEQLGRLFTAVEALDLSRNTIVIFTSDHGEEFGEHGASYHKSTVYAESTWVPLVVRVPGMQGSRIEKPTSSLYLMPWLLLAGEANLKSFAERRLETQIGPMLRATDGAVVIELIRADRRRASLVYPDYKINYHFISNLYEIYDVRADPLEQRDLFPTHPDLADRLVARMRQYREIRAGLGGAAASR